MLTVNAVRRLSRGGSSLSNQRRRQRPTIDKKTVELVLADEQLARLDRICHVQSKLWHRLATSAFERVTKTGWCESTYDLAYLLPGLKKADPELRILPAESAQNTARVVTQALKAHLGELHRIDRHLSSEERAKAKQCLADLQQRNAWSIHVNRIVPKRSCLLLPKLGWVEYVASDVLREILSREGCVSVRAAAFGARMTDHGA